MIAALWIYIHGRSRGNDGSGAGSGGGSNISSSRFGLGLELWSILMSMSKTPKAANKVHLLCLLSLEQETDKSALS